MTIAQLDNIAAGMERRWGIGRLPALMPEAWRTKFATLADQLNAAIAAGADTDAPATALIKAWQAMDAKATAQGAFPVAPAIEVRAPDGAIIAIVANAEEGHAASLLAQWEQRAVTVWDAQTMVAALHGNETMRAIQATFPGALVSQAPADMRPGKRRADLGHEEIPFGGEEAA